MTRYRLVSLSRVLLHEELHQKNASLVFTITPMAQFLEEHQVLVPSQHGFRKGRSCLTQLIDHYNSVMEELENGRGVDVVYLDILFF